MGGEGLCFLLIQLLIPIEGQENVDMGRGRRMTVSCPVSNEGDGSNQLAQTELMAEQGWEADGGGGVSGRRELQIPGLGVGLRVSLCTL